MSAVLLAVFGQYGDAERVRTRLVSDGFPTDRVELTASAEPGRAGLHPAGSRRAKFAQYFRTLLSEEDEREFADALAERVEGGTAATIAVHVQGGLGVSAEAAATAYLVRARGWAVAGGDPGATAVHIGRIVAERESSLAASV